MRRSTAFFGLLVVLALAGALVLKSMNEDPEPEPNGGEKDPDFQTKFVGAAGVDDFLLPVPAGWQEQRDPKVVIFRGPKEKGFHPNIHFYYLGLKGPLTRLFGTRRQVIANDPAAHIIGDAEPARIAGHPAWRLMYKRTERRKEFPHPLTLRWTDWYFVGEHGRCYLLRGVCTMGQSLHWGPIYDFIAANVQTKKSN